MAKIKVNDIKSARADVKVNEIKLAGAELFGDSESFISDLQDNELELAGGCPVENGAATIAGLCSNIVRC